MLEVTQHFPINNLGRDFAIGDLHGCFHLLNKELQKVSFNKQVDRLFSVGDLVDRGPYSEVCLEWLAQPWFYSVKGNHEELAIEFYNSTNKFQDEWLYIRNGGKWFVELPEKEQAKYVKAFDKLPLAIDVMTKNGLVGIVHAESPYSHWNDLLKALHNDEHNVAESVMWGRNRINRKDDSDVEGLYKLYCGHTPVDEVTQLGNVVYIDTGACFKDGHATILQFN